MTPLTLSEAASFLKIHPDHIRKEAKAGKIPGCKVGHLWRFIEEDLVVWLRSGYATPRQAPIVEVSKCQSLSEAKRGGSHSPRHKESELDIRLKQKIDNKLKSSTTI
jgi:excisionase family DNA binding protein